MFCQGRRERKRQPPFPGAKKFFCVQLENIKPLLVNNMWQFILFTEQDISDEK